eukprot:XP_001691395.1 PAN2-like protein [Chlamydomonas reinhardtii]
MYSSYGMSELAVAPLDASYPSAVTAMQFSPHYEAMWAGTEAGHLYCLQAPSLQPYAHWQAHPHGSPVLEVAAAGDGVMSLSAHRLCLHGLGGAPRWSLNDDSGAFSAVCLDAGGGGGGGVAPVGLAGARAVLGRSSARMSLVDVGTGRVTSDQEVLGLLGGEGVTLLRGPASRGALVAATSLGRLALIDPRAKLRADSALIAAPGGVAALDARGDTVAAAGYGMRAGTVVAENCVKLFDVRAGLRLLYTLPTSGPPAALAFHPPPLGSACLLVALPSAAFCLADTASGGTSQVYQADMASDQLSTACLSPSGDLEDDSFAAAVQYPPPSPPPGHTGPPPGLASDWEPAESSAVGLPPRVLDPAMRRELRVVDGVGYLPNPHYSRAKSLADMARHGGASGLNGGPRLNKWEEFDFAAHNSTGRFAGLENDLPNAYCNALFQALYFLPEFRGLVLAHVPEPDAEFCLTCELGFLDATNARTPSPGPFRSGIAPQPAPANAALAPALEALMGISFRTRMTCLTGGGGDSVRDGRSFQVDLQYPASREKAARAAEEARQLGLNRLPGAAPPMRSLLAAAATRAWVDEARGYALVKKVRVPVCLPPLLTVNVAVGDSSEAAWWLPAKGPAPVLANPDVVACVYELAGSDAAAAQDSDTNGRAGASGPRNSLSSGAGGAGARSQGAGTGTGRGHPQGPEWVLFNDFCVAGGIPPAEVTATYGNQKLPALLQYKQGAMANLPPFRFKPLDMVRMAPRPGTRFAIDAEFVASSPPESRALKQSRLTLARVAVVAAEPGPLAGSCCVDDYIRAVEPTYDYLTRWSGICPGDLDPQVSRHYTTTLKHTYLKLKWVRGPGGGAELKWVRGPGAGRLAAVGVQGRRQGDEGGYLLDCGCVFVGHDLRKDFRCINMVVPPEQLGHDAIEDARTAMRLYHKYLELTANDTFERVLNEMYAWGKANGWDPMALQQQGLGQQGLGSNGGGHAAGI